MGTRWQSQIPTPVAMTVIGVVVAFVLVAYWVIMTPRDRPTAELAEAWLQAVRDDRPAAALEAAATMVARDAGRSVDRSYEVLFEDEKLKAEFLAMPFSEVDYRSWRHAYRMQQLGQQEGMGASPEVLFEQVADGA